MTDTTAGGAGPAARVRHVDDLVAQADELPLEQEPDARLILNQQNPLAASAAT